MSEKMLLERLGKWLEQKVESGHKIYDIFICPWCSGTLQAITAHGFGFALGFIPFEWNWQLVIRYPLIVMAASFVAGMLWSIYLMINGITENNKNQAQYFKDLNSQPPLTQQ